jgi:transposase InsO family protein
LLAYTKIVSGPQSDYRGITCGGGNQAKVFHIISADHYSRAGAIAEIDYETIRLVCDMAIRNNPILSDYDSTTTPILLAYERSPAAEQALVHHSDRGSQYLSIRYTERLKDAGLEPSMGSVGDSYDNALAESIIGLYKTEVIRRSRPLARSVGGGVHHLGVGALVQSTSPARTDRACSTC